MEGRLSALQHWLAHSHTNPISVRRRVDVQSGTLWQSLRADGCAGLSVGERACVSVALDGRGHRARR